MIDTARNDLLERSPADIMFKSFMSVIDQAVGEGLVPPAQRSKIAKIAKQAQDAKGKSAEDLWRKAQEAADKAIEYALVSMSASMAEDAVVSPFFMSLCEKKVHGPKAKDGRTQKVISRYYDEIKQKQPGKSKEYYARVSWQRYCMFKNPGYEGCTKAGKTKETVGTLGSVGGKVESMDAIFESELVEGVVVSMGNVSIANELDDALHERRFAKKEGDLKAALSRLAKGDDVPVTKALAKKIPVILAKYKLSVRGKDVGRSASKRIDQYTMLHMDPDKIKKLRDGEGLSESTTVDAIFETAQQMGGSMSGDDDPETMTYRALAPVIPKAQAFLEKKTGLSWRIIYSRPTRGSNLYMGEISRIAFQVDKNPDRTPGHTQVEIDVVISQGPKRKVTVRARTDQMLDWSEKVMEMTPKQIQDPQALLGWAMKELRWT